MTPAWVLSGQATTITKPVAASTIVQIATFPALMYISNQAAVGEEECKKIPLLQSDLLNVQFSFL